MNYIHSSWSRRLRSPWRSCSQGRSWPAWSSWPQEVKSVLPACRRGSALFLSSQGRSPFEAGPSSGLQWSPVHPQCTLSKGSHTGNRLSTGKAPGTNSVCSTPKWCNFPHFSKLKALSLRFLSIPVYGREQGGGAGWGVVTSDATVHWRLRMMSAKQPSESTHGIFRKTLWWATLLLAFHWRENDSWGN